MPELTEPGTNPRSESDRAFTPSLFDRISNSASVDTTFVLSKAVSHTGMRRNISVTPSRLRFLHDTTRKPPDFSARFSIWPWTWTVDENIYGCGFVNFETNHFTYLPPC